MNITSLEQSIFIISVSIVSVPLYITEASHSHKLKYFKTLAQLLLLTLRHSVLHVLYA